MEEARMGAGADWEDGTVRGRGAGDSALTMRVSNQIWETGSM